MSARLVDAVIFDLDGTLVNSVPGIEYAAAAAWAAVQPGPPCPSLRSLIGPPIGEMFRRALPGADAATLIALEHTFRRVYDSEGWQKTVVYPGVPETLTALTASGVQCFGVTNKPSLPTQRILEHCGLRTYFRAFLSPDSVNPPYASKAKAVEALLTRHDLDSARTLFMGDSADDARAAHACGLRFAAFTGGYGQVQQFPVESVCAEFSDVLKLVQVKERDCHD
jgi:phosphoglycolate phosphatase